MSSPGGRLEHDQSDRSASGNTPEAPSSGLKESTQAAGGTRKIWTEGMALWTFMSVVMSFMQPVLACLSLSTRGALTSLADLIGHGELLPTTTSLSVLAAGALFISRAPAIRKLEVGMPALFIVMMASHYQADVAAALRSALQIDSETVVNTSLILHACAITIGSRCAWLAEER